MCDVIIHTAALTDLAWHFPGIHTTLDPRLYEEGNISVMQGKCHIEYDSP